MDSHCRHAAALSHFCKLHRVDAGVIESLAELDRNRFLYRLHHGGKDLFCLFGVFHKGGAFAVIHHLRHGTPHVHIDEIIWAVLNPGSNLSHDIRVRSKELDGRGAFLWVYLHQFLCIPVIVQDGLCTDHLRHHTSGPLFTAEQTKWQVRHSCHGCQYYIIFKNGVSYPQFHLSFLIQVQVFPQEKRPVIQFQ